MGKLLSRMRRLVAALCALGLVAGAGQAQTDPAKALRSRDVEERLAAVAELGRGGHEKAEALLVRALDDGDWEVREAAARALAGPGEEAAVAPHVEAAHEGPTRRVRNAAAQ
jgi:HEAT repeat protein